MMDKDEKHVAKVISDFLTTGDDRVASEIGTITFYENGPFTGTFPAFLARINDDLKDQYEVTLIVRRISR